MGRGAQKRKKVPGVRREPDSAKHPHHLGDGTSLGGKRPRSREPTSWSGHSPKWRISTLELAGAFGWHRLRPDALVSVREKLAGFERCTYAELFVAQKRRNHSVRVDKLSKSARERLIELKLDDCDELWSLRLSSTERVWGILREDVFHLLWWDPDHQVCPSALKHT